VSSYVPPDSPAPPPQRAALNRHQRRATEARARKAAKARRAPVAPPMVELEERPYVAPEPPPPAPEPPAPPLSIADRIRKAFK